jgi:adenylate cyclase, class 2
MPHLNVEIKARCSDPDSIREKLKEKNADFRGVDHQIDTYFNCLNGGMKLREGNIERSLIHFFRKNQAGPKKSDVALFYPPEGDELKELLIRAQGVRVVVDKKREIYFIDNVKFHIDLVKGLGSFMEIEAIDVNGKLGEKYIRKQCEEYLEYLEIDQGDLMEVSYSDMILEKK